MSPDPSTVFFQCIDDVDWLEPSAEPDKARPAKGSQARIKWIGGDSQTGPWVYYIEHPVGAVVKPHRHNARRVEYILDGEIEFFAGEEALAMSRGDETVSGSRHGPGTMSWVPPGTLYAYRITKATKLLHVFFENPVGRTIHVQPDGSDASEVSPQRRNHES
jgi:hypothetical protein